MEKEIFVPIVGYEGHYEISNYGNVKSLKRNRVLIMSPSISQGYRLVSLCLEGISNSHRVARLVALHFVEGEKIQDEVNHIDGITENDHYSNLEWTTRQENAIHACRVLKRNTGENHGAAKLKRQEVKEIKWILKTGIFNKAEIGRMYNVNVSTIRHISRGDSWKQVVI